MTLVSDIIIDAFRQGNLIAVNYTPPQEEIDEALRYLNRIISSVFGAEVGDPLTAIPLGRSGIARPSHFPAWNEDPGNEWYVPKNTRLILNLVDQLNLYLHPMPDDGTRFAIQDIAGNLNTIPVTVYGNGRLIDGHQSVVLDTDGLDRQWFYRADTGNWITISPLEESAPFPFPEEFDDYFITMLAMRLNPSYGVALDQQSQVILQRARTQLRARYKQNVPMMPQPGTVLLTRTSRQSPRWAGDFQSSSFRFWR